MAVVGAGPAQAVDPLSRGADDGQAVYVVSYLDEADAVAATPKIPEGFSDLVVSVSPRSLVKDCVVVRGMSICRVVPDLGSILAKVPQCIKDGSCLILVPVWTTIPGPDPWQSIQSLADTGLLDRTVTAGALNKTVGTTLVLNKTVVSRVDKAALSVIDVGGVPGLQVTV